MDALARERAEFVQAVAQAVDGLFNQLHVRALAPTYRLQTASAGS